MFSSKWENKDECPHGRKHHQDKCFVFSSKKAIKMSATVENTLRIYAMCSVYSEGRPMNARVLFKKCGNFAFLFNCTPVGRTSDSMMVPT